MRHLEWLDGEFKHVWLEPLPTTRVSNQAPFLVWGTTTDEGWTGWREIDRHALGKMPKTWPKAHWREVPPPLGAKRQQLP